MKHFKDVSLSDFSLLRKLVILITFLPFKSSFRYDFWTVFPPIKSFQMQMYTNFQQILSKDSSLHIQWKIQCMMQTQCIRPNDFFFLIDGKKELRWKVGYSNFNEILTFEDLIKNQKDIYQSVQNIWLVFTVDRIDLRSFRFPWQVLVLIKNGNPW